MEQLGVPRIIARFRRNGLKLEELFKLKFLAHSSADQDRTWRGLYPVNRAEYRDANGAARTEFRGLAAVVAQLGH